MLRSWFWRTAYAWRSFRLRGHEAELALLPSLVEPDEAALDIGANRALYTNALRALCSRVVAFEPVPALAERLRLACPDVTVHQLALSDRAGTVTLRLPGRNTSWATIEPGNDLSKATAAIVTHEVRTERLDAMQLGTVGFVKVDVEGHELAVLEGARGVLEEHHPTLLVELEERHTKDALQRARAFLEPLGYRGVYLDGGVLQPIQNFDAARDQNPAHVGEQGKSGRYLNNFVFLAEQRPAVRERVRAAGVHVAG